MNFKLLATTVLAALFSCAAVFADAGCSSTACGIGDTFELTFSATGSTTLGVPGDKITVAVTINGKTMTSPSVPYTQLAETPSTGNTVNILRQQIYEGEIVFSGGSSSTGCYYNVTANMSAANSCGLTLQTRVKPAGGGTEGWVEGGSISMGRGNRTHLFQLRLVKKADTSSAPDLQRPGGGSGGGGGDMPSTSGEAGGSGAGDESLMRGRLTPPTIPEADRGTPPAIEGAPPFHIDPVAFNFSVDLGANIGSQGYNVGTISLQGALSQGLVKVDNVKFANPGMPGIDLGVDMATLLNPETDEFEEKLVASQVHMFKPAVARVVKSDEGFGVLRDTGITMSEDEQLAMRNAELARSGIGQLIDIRNASETEVMVRFFEQGSFGECDDPTAPGTPGYTGIHDITGAPSKIVSFTRVPPGGDHAGGIRVTVTSANEITRVKEYLNLPGTNAWRESTLVNGVAIESTDRYSNFWYDGVAERWERTDFEQVTRDGVLYAKSSRTYAYLVEDGGAGTHEFLLEKKIHDKVDSDITTTWEPDEDIIGQAASMSRSDGYWEVYRYYHNGDFDCEPEWHGKLKETLRPFNGSPASAALATSTNSESTVLTYGYFSEKLEGFNPPLEVLETVSTRPSSISGVETLEYGYKSKGADPEAMVSQLENAGLSAGWKPLYASIISRDSSKLINGEFFTTRDFVYKWALDPSASWVGGSFGQIDENGDGVATGHERGKYLSTGSGTYTFTVNDHRVLDLPGHEAATDVRSVSVNIINAQVPHRREAVREVVIRDSKGIPYVREFSIKNDAGAWVVVSTTTYYVSERWPDNSVKSYSITRDGRLIYRARSEAAGYNILETVTDEQGIETRTLTDPIGRVKKVTRVGTATQPDIVTDFLYSGRTTNQVVTAGSITRTTITKEDLMGRPVYEKNPSNAVTETFYENDGRDTRTVLPGSLECLVTRTIDGLTTSITGSAVVPEYYTYEMNGPALSTTKCLGEPNSARRTLTVRDTIGRVIDVYTPNPAGGADVDYYSTYHPGTLRLESRSSPLATFFSARSATYPMVTVSGVDSNADGYLIPGSTDRVEESGSYYAVEEGFGWQVSYRKIFDVDGSDASAITTITKTCLHGNPDGNAYKTVTTSPTGETVTTTTSFVPGQKRRVTVRASSTVSAEEIETDINGLILSRKDRNGSTPARWEYNGLGQITKAIYPRGASTRSYYNADGSLASSFDAFGKKTSYDYYGPTHKSAGKLLTITYPIAPTTPASPTPTAPTKTYIYSDLGKVKEVTGTAAYKVTYDYDIFGAMDEMKTWRNASTSDLTQWIYQPGTGLLSSKIDAASKITEYTYYPHGKLKTRKWARKYTPPGGSPIDLIATYSYNGAGDLTGIDYSDNTPDVLLTNLDRLGRPRTVSQGGVVTEKMTYHAGSGRLASRYNDTTHSLLPNLGVSYGAPDAAGRATGFTETSSSSASTPTEVRTIGYSYDPATGNLQTITDGSQTHDYAYHANSSLVDTIHSKASGTAYFQQKRYYDNPGRLTGIVSNRVNSGTPTPMSRHSYAYDDLGRRTKNTMLDGSYWQYGYNDLSEVTSAKRWTPGATEITPLAATYTYDGIGNRLTSNSPVLGNHTYTPNALNQYASITTNNSRTAVGRADASWTVQVETVNASRIGEIYHQGVTATNTSNPVWKSVVTKRSTGTPTFTNRFWYAKTPTVPTYDLDGNLTNDGRWTYVWDAENRLIQMEILQSNTTTPVSHSSTKLKFDYDWQGRRIARTVWQNGTFASPTFKSKTAWLYDGWNIVAEFNLTNATPAVVSRVKTYTWGLDLSGTLQGAGGVGGLLAQTTVSGGAIQCPSYDGNGNIVAWTASNGSAPTARREYDAFGNIMIGEGAWPSSFGFSTKPQDTETGLYYYGYRFYNAEHGRWLNRDPIGEGGGINLFAMVMNKPTLFVDVLGLTACTCDCDGAPDLTSYINEKINAVLSQYKGNTAGGLRSQIDKATTNGGKLEKDLNEKGKKCTQNTGKPGGLMKHAKLASTFKLCGECVGSDKVAHFFEEGAIYHDIAKMPRKGKKNAEDFGKWLEGMDPKVTTQSEYDFLDKPNITVNFLGNSTDIPIKPFLDVGTIEHYGAFGDRGLDTNGDSSPADLAANSSGMDFWNDIYAADYGSGKKGFGTFNICNYVKEGWDHTKNPNVPSDPKPPRPK